MPRQCSPRLRFAAIAAQVRRLARTAQRRPRRSSLRYRRPLSTQQGAEAGSLADRTLLVQVGSRVRPVRLDPAVLCQERFPEAGPEHDLSGPAAAPPPVARMVTALQIGELTYMVARAPSSLKYAFEPARLLPRGGGSSWNRSSSQIMIGVQVAAVIPATPWTSSRQMPCRPGAVSMTSACVSGLHPRSARRSRFRAHQSSSSSELESSVKARKSPACCRRKIDSLGSHTGGCRRATTSSRRAST